MGAVMSLLRRAFCPVDPSIIIEVEPRGRETFLYIERPCIGCLKPFKKWHVREIPVMEQFCSKRCRKSFFHGCDVGRKILGSVSRWAQANTRQANTRRL